MTDRDLSCGRAHAALRRRTFLTTGVASGLCAASRAGAEGSGSDLLAALYDLSWVADGRSDAHQAYVIYAPWCPVCKHLYRVSRSLVGNLQLRWVPSGTRDERSRMNNERIATSRDHRQLDQLFSTGDASGSGNRFAVDFNESVIYAETGAINGVLGSQYGYPTVVYRTAGGVRAFAGVPEDFEDRLKASLPLPGGPARPRVETWLARSIVERERPQNKLAVPRKTIELRALPFEDAPAVESFPTNTGYPADAVVEADGSQWVAIVLLKKGTRAFAPAAMVELRQSS
jgi:hypothetical protein